MNSEIKRGQNFEHLSLRDMAMSGVRNGGEENGIAGYALPDFDVKIPARSFKIRDVKKNYGGMLDTILKAKSLVPSPSQYKIRTTFEPPKHTKTFGNPVTSRSPRITEAG